ncbi:MAG: GTPase Era [Caulobacteraceae bacterium]|nr:GTPase Era [Caulobacteraceae bacterium]
MAAPGAGGVTRAGFAAVIGAPNAGKSTLVNALVGAKVTIVTQKVQTTRFPIRGVAIEGESQIVLVDTPGIFSPRRRLDRAMVRAAWAGAEDADAVVHLVDSPALIADDEASASPADRKGAEDSHAVTGALAEHGVKAMLVLNKIDLVAREALLPLTERLHATGAYGDVLMISATTGEGVADLKARLAAAMPEGPWLYPPDQTADLPQRLLAAEITREKIYLRVHEELPYQAAVETTAYEARADGSVRIEQTIYVTRDGQRGILLGKGGQTLKWIGEAARRELAAILGHPVHLFLYVKVKANWAEERGHYQGLGLDFDA